MASSTNPLPPAPAADAFVYGGSILVMDQADTVTDAGTNGTPGRQRSREKRRWRAPIAWAPLGTSVRRSAGNA